MLRFMCGILGATMPALHPRKVETFLDPPCEGHCYSPSKIVAHRVAQNGMHKKAPRKCAQGSVAHFQL